MGSAKSKKSIKEIQFYSVNKCLQIIKVQYMLSMILLRALLATIHHSVSQHASCCSQPPPPGMLSPGIMDLRI